MMLEKRTDTVTYNIRLGFGGPELGYRGLEIEDRGSGELGHWRVRGLENLRMYSRANYRREPKIGSP